MANGSDMTTEPEHPRATTASIDRRVERLELAQQATDRKVDDLRTEVTFMNRIFELKFESLETAVTANTNKLDGFINKIEAMITEAMKNAGDLRAQPLGRGIDDRLNKIEAKMETQENSLDELRGVSGAVRSFLFPGLALMVSIGTLIFAISQHGMH